MELDDRTGPALGGLAAAPTAEAKGRVLVVDDEVPFLRSVVSILSNAGFDVKEATSGDAAAELLGKLQFDVVVSDISMPGMDGVELLRKARERDLDLPVVLMTGSPAVETAVKALEFGALRYLLKPFDSKVLEDTVQFAARLCRMARIKRELLAQLGAGGAPIGDRAGLEAGFVRALGTLWMAVQPIVDWRARAIYGYEALVRTREPSLPHPGALFGAAERLGRVHELGRAIRGAVAEMIGKAPPDVVLFVNLHSQDLADETLYSPTNPISPHAKRVVLEITERASLEEIRDPTMRVTALRSKGYRIAVDDLGAGYAGLTTFAQLEPEVVKLDMSLVRGVHKEATKQRVIRSMTGLCHEMGMLVVAEGVETVEERDELTALGCDLLQGYLFAKPGPDFTPFLW